MAIILSLLELSSGRTVNLMIYAINSDLDMRAEARRYCSNLADATLGGTQRITSCDCGPWCKRDRISMQRLLCTLYVKHTKRKIFVRIVPQRTKKDYILPNINIHKESWFIHIMWRWDSKRNCRTPSNLPPCLCSQPYAVPSALWEELRTHQPSPCNGTSGREEAWSCPSCWQQPVCTVKQCIWAVH